MKTKSFSAILKFQYYKKDNVKKYEIIVTFYKTCLKIALS